jgi:hypothetical protein
VSPLVGDQLVFVGSPCGLEGTVTTAVVSRVTYDAIQTGAAANPGSSGGPAVDQQGQVVGVPLGGGSENLSLAVPIQRAWVTAEKSRLVTGLEILDKMAFGHLLFHRDTTHGICSMPTTVSRRSSVQEPTTSRFRP